MTIIRSFVALMLLFAATAASAQKAAPQLLTPQNSMIIFIDHSPLPADAVVVVPTGIRLTLEASAGASKEQFR